MFSIGAQWNNDTTLEFLEYYKGEPMLWDPNHRDHKNKVETKLAWERIKDDMSVECSVSDLKRKKESLMASYRLQCRKKRLNPDFKSCWFAYEFMDAFLGRVYCEKFNDITFSDTEFLLNNSDDHSYIEETPPPIKIKSERRSSRTTSKHTPRKRPIETSLSYKYNEIPEKHSREEFTDMDECELYAKLLAKKMRRLDQRQREIVMHEIDNLMFRARMNNEGSSKLERKSESPVFIVTDSNTHYETEYLEDPMQN